MKRLLTLLALGGTLALTTSCEKCMTCSYSYDSYQNGLWDNVAKTEEYCGNDDDLDAAEADFKEAASANDKRNKGPVVCTRD